MKKIAFFACLLPLFNLCAQDGELNEYEVRKMANEADKAKLVYNASAFLQDGFFFYSEILTDKLLSLDPESPNYNYRKGFIELETRHDAEAAIPHFKKATTDMHKNFDAYSPKERRAPIDALFHLGRCYHLTGKLDEAIETFNLFKEQSNKKSERVLEADLMIKQCIVAKEFIKNPTNATIKNLGSKVNGEYPDYAPTISLDGKSLYYTSRRPWKNGETDIYRDQMYNHFPEDIYESNLAGDEWNAPVMAPFSTDQYNEATVSISADERRIYIYKDSIGGGDLFFSDIDNGIFGKINHIKDRKINSDAWDPHCTVTPDLQHMYFSSDRAGGFGGRDIYRITRLPNGEWSEPQNLGPTINTPFDEDAPHIDVNNKTLYYSSNGDKSMGGFDIFYSIRDEDYNWLTPINLGSPINSFDDDIYYTTTADGRKGYFSSFRNGGFGEKDIYEVKNDYLGHESVSFLSGKFYTMDGTPLPDNLKAEISCVSCSKDNNSEELTLKNGSFYTLLKRCQDYKANFYNSQGALIKTESFNTKCDKSSENIEMNIPIMNYELQFIAFDVSNNEQLEGVSIQLFAKNGDALESHTTMSDNISKSTLLAKSVYGDKINYAITAGKDKYLTKNIALDTTLLDQSVILVKIAMDQLNIGDDIATMIDINPIYFDLNKYNIRPDAAIELDKIVQVMKDNPKIVIELGSHTDCRGSKSYNTKLSDRRAKASAQYIRQRIDNPKRIYGKGYGESQLINDCECEGKLKSDCSEEEHQQNRRTEFKIVKK